MYCVLTTEIFTPTPSKVGVHSSSSELGSPFHTMASPSDSNLGRELCSQHVTGDGLLRSPEEVLVMVVDDTPMNFRLMKAMAKSAGCRTILMNSGEEAVLYFQNAFNTTCSSEQNERLPDVVLMALRPRR
uniref:Response regulatory domain-containing protein n=1 Tax=Eutreptiella gymnastica TaxID=73025 RepID=A0A7S1IC38_9EUGL|mmetsp:Transcript_146377/g.255674  ORF Transcript_146377/g.255674 Transcript_146377/m.255674 type:complete len:130 (+) Transcript_146377:27-416(+)